MVSPSSWSRTSAGVSEGLPPLLTPELYHGEGMVGYSIVGTEQTELSDDDLEARYSGSAGVSIGSTVRQAAFARRFGEIEPLISDSITSESKVIYVRDIVEGWESRRSSSSIPTRTRC